MKGIGSYGRHVNIPIFIPHVGCPNTCVFCNQRKISGVKAFSPDDVEKIIDEALSTCDPETDEVEVAFFGGSFTGIPFGEMVSLLELVRPYVESGKVKSLRCSTRPDYISEKIINTVKRYGMKTIELGIQSMSDAVLSACKRGHTAQVSAEACRMIKNAGITLVGQMMTGLPGSTRDDEIMTAETLCALGCDAVRIYPTMVFAGTELENMEKRGEYASPALARSLSTVADLLEIFDRSGVSVIRVGLCSSDGLDSEDGIVSGGYEPSFGDMAKGEVFRRREELVFGESEALHEKSIIIECPIGAVSAVSGHKRSNKEYLREKFGVKKITVRENGELSGYDITIRADERYTVRKKSE